MGVKFEFRGLQSDIPTVKAPLLAIIVTRNISICTNSTLFSTSWLVTIWIVSGREKRFEKTKWVSALCHWRLHKILTQGGCRRLWQWIRKLCQELGNRQSLSSRPPGLPSYFIFHFSFNFLLRFQSRPLIPLLSGRCKCRLCSRPNSIDVWDIDGGSARSRSPYISFSLFYLRRENIWDEWRLQPFLNAVLASGQLLTTLPIGGIVSYKGTFTAKKKE